MKKALSVLVSCFLLVFCFTLVSCGATKVSGTYKLYQVITIENNQMTVEDALDGEPTEEDDSRSYKDYITMKFNKDGTLESKFFELETTASWKLEGSTLTVTSEAEEGEDPTTSTAYVNGSYIYYTMVQNDTRTVILVLKKEPFKISSLFKKKDAAQTATTSTEESATTSTTEEA